GWGRPGLRYRRRARRETPQGTPLHTPPLLLNTSFTPLLLRRCTGWPVGARANVTAPQLLVLRPAFACANTPRRNTKSWGAVTLARAPRGLPMQPRNNRGVKLVFSKKGGVCRGVPRGVLGRARLR